MVRQLRGEDFLLGYLKKKERGNLLEQQGFSVVVQQQWRVVGLLLLTYCHSLQSLTITAIFSILHAVILLHFLSRRRLLVYATVFLLVNG